LAGAPFFLRRGGLGPLFVHFALLLKKKRNSRGIFQKMSSREFLKRCSRQNLRTTIHNTDRNTESPANLIPSKILIPKKLLVTPWYISNYYLGKMFLQPAHATHSECITEMRENDPKIPGKVMGGNNN
jgi:hypothetical protein